MPRLEIIAWPLDSVRMRQFFFSEHRRLIFMRFLIALLLLAGCLSAPAVGFKFAWLSDTHVGSQTAADDLRASVQDINSLEGVSFVLLSGDVTEYGTREQLKLAKSILDELKVPSYSVPGNHDTKWSESGATDFARIWPADRFHFEHGGFQFIGLHQGPLMKMGDGHWAPQDVRWLEKTLKHLGTEKPIIFVTHYPIDEGIANWYVVLDLLKQYNVQAVLCGHGHANKRYIFEGVPGIMGRSNLRARESQGGYNVVEVTDGQMTFTERKPSGQTLPTWHKIQLKRHDFRSDTNSYPRPDFSVNKKYPNVREEWVFDAGYTVASTPALAGDLAIVGDASGMLRALSVTTGKPAWTFKTGNAIYSTPAVSGDTLVVPSADGAVYALRASTGKKIWKHETGRPIVASPAVAGDKVYLGSSEGKFRAYDLATGKTAWEFEGLGNFVETRPLLYDGKVIFGAWDQHLYALDARTGSLAWKWKGDRPGALLSPAACWPVAANGKVFIVAPDRQMTAINVPTGEQLWRTGEYVVRESIGLSEDSSRFFVRAMNDFVYAFSTSASRPEKLWECNAMFGYDINSAMLPEKDGVVFYGTKNGLLIAFSAANGSILWQHKFGSGLMNTVLPLGKDRVLVTDFDGRIALIQSDHTGAHK
jgi:outer membrane protein assembly factor BamB/predicted MPP superfamily phosphohydrolase